MKISNILKIVTGVLFSGMFLQTSFSQKVIDAYKIERDGYFTSSVNTAYGTFFTDNSANKIYLAKDEKLMVVANTPGCGRYFCLSPDQSKIGYKKIYPDRKQVPAILDLATLETTELSDPQTLCGQVSFSNNGKIAFTVGNVINVSNNGITEKYTIGTYSNIAPISLDGNFVVYNNDSDQLFLMELSSNSIIQITDGLQGYAFPQWSPDGSKIVYSSLPGILYVYDLTTGHTFSIGTGSHPSWTEDSQYLIYDIIKSENLEFLGSDIYRAKYDGSDLLNITSTTSSNEMYPFVSGDKIFFSAFEGKSLVSSFLNDENHRLQIIDTLYTSDQSLDLSFENSYFTSQEIKLDTVAVPGEVPYVHQRWDTPDWHAGSGSCAPSTAIMAIGYFNRLPYWDITCASNPTNHTSHYGAYVADKYRFNEVYYDSLADAYGTDAWGGYGWMWATMSPNSKMHIYIGNHGISSVHSYSTTFQNVTDEIDAGYPYSICSLLSTAGHLTLTVGYVVGQHTLIFNDPYGNKNLGDWGSLNNGRNSYYDWPSYNNGYQNLNTMAWTVTSETSEPAYNDTIIDDVYYNHGFYVGNQNPSHMKFFHDNITGGYNNHFWWTYTSASTTVDTCYVTWTPNLPNDGDYEVFAYIPTTNASATTAKYNVYYNGGNQTITINQAPIYGEWVSLGTFSFLAGNSGYVRLGDATGVQSQKIAFDAMKFVNVTQPAAVAAFTSSSSSVCEGTSVSYTNTSTNATSYFWTFEGGNPATSIQTSPSVTYSTSGNYNVELIATSTGGNDTLIMTNYIFVNPSATAGFSAEDTVYLPSPSVNFTNTSTNASSYVWNFGDGATSASTSPSHTYNVASNFIVTLIAVSACGNDTTTAVVHVLNPAPVAAFSASLTTICAGDTILFTNSSTYSTSYNWIFSGGTPATSSLQNPLVTYANAGTYDAQLVVTGPGGSDTITHQNYITVNPMANAQFNVNNTQVYLPSANVIFTNTSQNAASYFWDFGDGSNSTDQNPWHNYTATGLYTITLIAYNSQCGNDTLILPDYILVDVATTEEEMDSTLIGLSVIPNPSNGQFSINYELKNSGNVELRIFDVRGKMLWNTQKKSQAAGKYVLNMDKELIHSSKGIYFIELLFERESAWKKIIMGD